ncbi:hypothetical protein D3C75_873230 [compost metagenome]
MSTWSPTLRLGSALAFSVSWKVTSFLASGPFTVTWRLARSMAVTCVVTWLSSASLPMGIPAACTVKLAVDARVARATARTRERIGFIGLLPCNQDRIGA